VAASSFCDALGRRGGWVGHDDARGLEGLLAGGRRRGSAPLERTVLVAAVFLSALLAGAAVGLALWLADTVPPAALSAALSCHH
jgi:hypothetical protein